MLEIAVYGVGFFICTMIIQALLAKIRKKGNKGNSAIWVGSSAIIIICIVGLATKNVNYLAAVLGFVMADEIGQAAGWH
jgi:asparagine N-glycosylation enzyme membrane subunit Stt3